MRAFWVLSCLLVLVLAGLSPLGTATDISTFAGGDFSLELSLLPPELCATAEVGVPWPSVPLSGSMNVSTVADQAPLSPSIDVGGDGAAEWEFSGTGHGAFGAQTVLSDGSSSFGRVVVDSLDARLGLLLPKGAVMRSATAELTGSEGAPAQASALVGPFDLASGGQQAFDDLEVPDAVRGVNASVRLSGGTRSAKDAECTAWSNFKIFGWQGVQYQSLAQTFTPSSDCNLSKVELQVNMVVGSPGPLYIEIRNTDASGKPTTAVSPQKSIAQASVTAPGWNPVTFSPAVDLSGGTKYALVAHAKDASTSGTNEYVWYGSALDDPYPGGCLWIYAPDADASGTPTQSSLVDQAFRIHVQGKLGPSEMGQVKVNDISPTSSDGMGGYIYDFSSPTYHGNVWAVTVKNLNGFNVSFLELNATTWYVPRLHDLSLGLDAHIQDWWHAPPLAGTVVIDLKAPLERELPSTPSWPDDHGNQMCQLNITLKALGSGGIRFEKLEIRYDLTLAVGDLTAPLEAFLQGRPEGTVRVPLVARALSAGKLKLSGLLVRVDAPPVLLSPIPSTFTLPEEGQDEALADLSAHFVDDFGCTFRCLPAESANASNLEFWVCGTVLGARALKVNWSGTVQLAVEAVDIRDQRTVSSNFLVTVTEVNDAPAITSIPPAGAEAGKDYAYQLAVEDDENDTLTFTLGSAPAGMTLSPSGLVRWRPGAQDLGATQNITIIVSDGKLATSQTFSLAPFTSDRPPSVQPAGDLTARAGTPFDLQVEAADPDGDALAFSLEGAPQGMSINGTGRVSWASPKVGNYTVRVVVSDGLMPADTTFRLNVLPAVPPAITSVPPARARSGAVLSYQVVVNVSGPGAEPAFELVSGPPGMNISATGLVTWKPSSAQGGTHHVVLRVRVGNETAVQPFDVSVAPAKGGKEGEPELPAAVIVAVAAVLLTAGAAALFLRRKGKHGKPS